MHRSLYAKLALVLILLLLGMAALYLPLSLHSTRLYLQETEQAFNRDLASRLAASRPLMDAGGINDAMLKEIFDIYMVINPNIEVYLLDATGRILDFALPPAQVKLDAVDLGPVRKFLRPNAKLPILGDDPTRPGRHTVFSAAVVETPNAMQGYLYVVLRSERYRNLAEMVQESHILRMVLLFVGATLAAGLITGLLLFRLLTRRLRRLSDAMASFSDGDQPPSEELLASFKSNGDEVDRLGVVYKEMTDRIHRQVAALRDQDRLRRELVANASHDLRTPLAALRGYLETMEIKQASLDQRERGEYLKIALEHSDRMSRLVEELFELARLEALDYRPAPEPLVLAELTQDVMQKYAQRAAATGITVQMHAEGPQPLIQADIGMMERVLENLLENALRHTPDGGQVDLSVYAEPAALSLEVADTGCGIPEAELPQVFERYFKGSTSRSGTGLGLAIARRIVELHHGEIDVQSKQGDGSRFIVRLPR